MKNKRKGMILYSAWLNQEEINDLEFALNEFKKTDCGSKDLIADILITAYCRGDFEKN